MSTTRTRRPGGFKLSWKDIMGPNPERGAEDQRPPLARYRLPKPLEAHGACYSIEGPDARRYYEAFRALGAIIRWTGRTGQGKAENYRYLFPVARWDTDPLLRARVAVLLLEACNARALPLKEAQLRVALLLHDEKAVTSLSGEIALLSAAAKKD